jgi:hypothetical protein
MVVDSRRKYMTDPKKGAINASENLIGGSKFTSNNSAATRVSEGNRTASDERRFQDALEDDEVGEALRGFHDRKR